MGQVALEPDGSMTMNVVQPLVLHRSRRDAAERRSLRCATDRWLRPAVVMERDNILDSLSGAHPRIQCGVALGLCRSTTVWGRSGLLVLRSSREPSHACSLRGVRRGTDQKFSADGRFAP
jgi:hypothetical protein